MFLASGEENTILWFPLFQAFSVPVYCVLCTNVSHIITSLVGTLARGGHLCMHVSCIMALVKRLFVSKQFLNPRILYKQ